jgi:hypothetical protein
VFLRCNHFPAAGVTKESVLELWKGDKYCSEDYSEWHFFLEFAASCICDEDKLGDLLETSELDNLGCIPDDGCGQYSVIERLLVASNSW